MGLNAMMLVFWMLSFKSAFSLSSLAEANYYYYYYFVTFKYIILDLFNSLNDKGNLQLCTTLSLSSFWSCYHWLLTSWRFLKPTKFVASYPQYLWLNFIVDVTCFQIRFGIWAMASWLKVISVLTISCCFLKIHFAGILSWRSNKTFKWSFMRIITPSGQGKGYFTRMIYSSVKQITPFSLSLRLSFFFFFWLKDNLH